MASPKTRTSKTRSGHQRKRPKKIVELKSVTLAPEMDQFGRPPSYREEYAEQARAMCQLGATDRDLASYFEVSTVTIWNWQARYKDFSSALKRGKEAADDRVERSLYARATGYTYDSVKVFNNDGEIIKVPVLEHVPPDVTACIFWLKNRRPAEWRDKTDHDHQHTHSLKLQGGNMSITDAQALFRQARNSSPQELEQSLKQIEGKRVA